MATPEHRSNPHIPVWTLGDRLAKSLDHAGMTRVDMGEHLDYSKATIDNYISGRTSPRRNVLRTWALRTGVPFEWLAYGIVDLVDEPDHDGPNEGIMDRRTRSEPSEPLSTWIAPVLPMVA